MTILTIRKHQRFAVRHAVRLVTAGERSRSGLLVEVSLEGCRLGLAGSYSFAAGQPVSVRVGRFGIIKATVRWSGDGFIGLRFDAPLHNAELGELMDICRPAYASAPAMRAYGT